MEQQEKLVDQPLNGSSKNINMSRDSRQDGFSSIEQAKESIFAKAHAHDILSITDCAVKNLDKSIPSRYNCFVDANQEPNLNFPILSSNNCQENPYQDEIFRSDKSKHSNNRFAVGLYEDKRRIPNVPNEGHFSDKHDESDLANLNSSNSSKASVMSRSSLASSAFLTGDAKHVKVSSKKLQEITSPFDKDVDGNITQRSDPTHIKPAIRFQPHVKYFSENQLNLANYNTKLVNVSNHDQTTDILSKSHQTEAQCTDIKSKQDLPEWIEKDEKLKKYNPVVTRELKSEKCKNENRGHIRFEPNSQELDGSKTVNSKQLLDSGYMTQTGPLKQVIHEVRYEIDENGSELNDKSSTIKSDVGLENGSISSQPEIVTVPETIVTVRATDQNQHHLASSLNSSQNSYPSTTSSQQGFPNLQDRFLKYHPSVLRQGTLVQNTSSSTIQDATAKQNREVEISHFSLDSKQKTLKQDFLKRHGGTGPVKRVVQPKLVRPEICKTQKQTQEQQAASNIDAATTAAVAAASAVAATQPFLRAQQEMESQMAKIVTQLSSVQQLQQNKQQTSADQDQNIRRIQQLEQQLADLTQHRLHDIEKQQRQQFDWQTHMLAMSRNPTRHVMPPGEHLSYQQGRDLHPTLEESRLSVGGRPKYSRVNTSAVMSQASQILDEERETAKSPLDTPAPRKQPPLPTSFDGSHMSQENKAFIQSKVDKPNSGAFLAQILSDDAETLKQSPYPDTPPGREYLPQYRSEPSPHVSATLKQASDLVNELGDLKHQLRGAIHNAGQWRKDFTRLPQGQVETVVGNVALQNPDSGPAPLDGYLMKAKTAPPMSPYPSLKDLDKKARVETPSDVTEAEDALRVLQRMRSCFETNLDAVNRGRQQTQLFQIMDQLTSGGAEKIRIQRLVDEYIQDLNTEVQREVLDEVSKLKDKQRALDMIPERDTSGPRGRPGVKAKVTAKPKSEFKAAGRVTRPELGKRPEKENVPQKKPKKPKVVKNLEENEAYMRRVYGKAPYQAQRSMQKEPYLRYQSTAAPSKTAKLLPHVEVVKGVSMATAKTQTSPADGAQAEEQYYFIPANARGQQQPTYPAPREGQIIPMAVPLGEARKQGGLTEAITLPSSQPFSSTPIPEEIQTKSRVAMVTIKDDTEEDIVREQRKPVLSKQVLPRVDIDSILVEPPGEGAAKTPDVRPCSSRQPGSRLEQVKWSPGKENFGEEEEQDVSSLEGPAVDLPGYQAKSATYHGPDFPPKAPPIAPQQPSSDVLAADIRRRDLLENKALDWVEQELMARLISEISANRRQHETVSPRPIRHDREDYSCDSYEEDSEISQETEESLPNDSLVAGLLGEEGLQLFVDVGQPIDENMVNALVKEVIQEKIASSVGQRTALDDEAVVARPQPARPQPARPQPRTTPADTARGMPKKTMHPPILEEPPEQGHFSVKPPSTPVATPEPTPEPTPISSPARLVSPAITPEVTPAPSAAEEEEDDEEYSSQFEPSIKDDVSRDEKLPRVMEDDIEEEEFVSRHDVITPVNTPPASPVHMVKTPDVTLRDSSPEPSRVRRSLSPSYKPDYSRTMKSLDSTLPEDHLTTQEYLRETAVSEEADDEQSRVDSQRMTPSHLTPSATKTRKSKSSTLTMTETLSATTSLSETINERISEGQWLLSVHSEGEVSRPQIDPDIKDRIHQQMLEAGDNRHLLNTEDDSLLDTEELEQDQDELATHSEGEFMHHGVLRPKQESLLEIVKRLKQPAEYVLPPTVDNHIAQGTDKSLGEVSLGQRPPLQPSAEKAVLGQSKAGLPVGAGQSLAVPSVVISQGEVETSIHSDDNTKSVEEPADLAPPESPAESNQTSDHVADDVRRSPVQSRPRYKAPSTSPQMYPGGRGKGRVHPSLGHIMASDSPGFEYTRYKPKPHMTSSDGPVRQSADDNTGLDGRGTLSDLGTRTMTPEQMNTDALLASRNYYMLASESEPHAGAERKQSGMSVGDRSASLPQTMTYSLTSDMSLPDNLRNTMDSTDRLAYTGGSTGLGASGQYDVSQDDVTDSKQDEKAVEQTDVGAGRPEYRQLQVTIPSVVEDDSVSGDDISEYSLPDQTS